MRKLFCLFLITGWLSGKILGQQSVYQNNLITIGSDFAVAPQPPQASVEVIDNLVDASGNQYACGRYKGTNVAFGNGNTRTSNSGSWDLFLARYNSSGICQWVVSVGGPDDFDLGHSIALDRTGNRVVLTGDIHGTDLNFNPLGASPVNVNAPFVMFEGGPKVAGFFLASFSTNGNCQWAIVPSPSATQSNQINGVGYNSIDKNQKHVVTDNSGDIYLAGGYVTNFTDFDPGAGISDFGAFVGGGGSYLARYTRDGTFVSKTIIHDTEGQYYARVNRLCYAQYNGENAVFVLGSRENSGKTEIYKYNTSTDALSQPKTIATEVARSRNCLAAGPAGSLYFSGWAGIPDGVNAVQRIWKLDFDCNAIAEKDVSTHFDLAYNSWDNLLYGVGYSGGGGSTGTAGVTNILESVDPVSLNVVAKTSFTFKGMMNTLFITGENGKIYPGGNFNCPSPCTSPSLVLGDGTPVSLKGNQDGFLGKLTVCQTPRIGEISGPAYNICANSLQSFTAVLLPGLSSGPVYEWGVPGGWTITTAANAGSIQVQVGSFSPPATQTLQVRATSTCNTGNGSTINLTSPYTFKSLFPYLPAPQISIAGIPPGPGAPAFCPNVTLNLSAPVEGATSYEWTIPSGLEVTGPTNGPAIVLRTPEQVQNLSIRTIKVKALGTCRNSLQVSQEIIVNPNAPASISLSNLSLCEGEVNYLKATAQSSAGIGTNMSSLVLLETESTIPPDWTLGTGTYLPPDYLFNLTVPVGSPNTSATLRFRAENNCGVREESFNVSVTGPPVLYFQDLDGDGLGNGLSGTTFCFTPGFPWVSNDSDCDDTNPASGLPLIWWPDADGDGYGSAVSDPELNCTDPSVAGGLQYVRNNADCNDANALEFNSVWYRDNDLDDFGDVDFPIVSCSDPSTAEIKYVRNRRDCNDASSIINPRRFEDNTDGLDNDCDGLVDEGSDPPGTTYCDLDGDGFGDPGCPIPPAGRMASKGGVQVFLASTDGVENNTDCDDTNPAVNALAFEFTDDKDNDCNGVINDSGSPQTTWYFDSDGDGYGDAQLTLSAASQPQGYVANAGDCNDNNAAVNPGAAEICGNGIDDNCNNQTDENNPLVNTIPPQSVCNQTSTIGFSITGSAGAAFSWTNPDPSIGLPATGSGPDFPSFRAINTTAASRVVNIQVVASAGAGCTSSPVSFQLTINPSPQVQAGADFSVARNAGNVQLAGLPAGGSWSGTGVSTSGLFNPTQTPGSYPLIYCFSNVQECRSCDTLLATVTQPAITQVEKPVITPGTGIVSAPANVSISCATPDVSIYYTTSGNIPVVGTTFTKLYTGPFQILQTTTVRAIAVRSGLPNSPVAASFLTIPEPAIAATPLISPGSGTYAGIQTVTMSTTTPGAAIYYTTSGNIPRLDVPNSFTRLYTGPFTVNSSVTIRAIAVKTGLQNSSLATVILTLTNPALPVSTPVISPATALFTVPQTVFITCSTPGATIYYTTNGNTPRLDVPNSFTRVYSGPFVVSATTTVRALATATGLVNSPVAVSYITIGPGRMAFTDENNHDPENPQIQLSPNIPNPFSDETSIAYFIPEGNGDGQLEVVSLQGKILQTERIPEATHGEMTIRKGMLSPGTYFYRIRTTKGLTAPRKMVIQ